MEDIGSKNHEALRFDDLPIVLVVDDTPANLHILLDTLKDEYTVIVARDGDSALNLVKIAPLPDLILLDVVMPGIDGYEVCARLKADPTTADIPIIFLTIKDEERDEAKGLALGAIDYITKPFSPAIVSSRVCNQIQLVKQRSALLRLTLELADAKNVAEEAMREAERARDISENANRSKSEFLANMSHEIRTPINAVMGMHYLLQQTQLNEQQCNYLDKAESGAHSLLGIINDILDFSKIEAGMLEIEAIEFRIGDVMEQLIDIISSITRKKDIELVFLVAPHVPDFLVGDPGRLGQILLNLANNAIKFTSKGSILISVTPISEDNGGVTLRFSVCDTGIGMTPEQMNKLFQAFTQADTSTTRKYGGTGLGLTISKKLVEKMGGVISVTSVLDEGSEFAFVVRFGFGVKPRSFVVPVDRVTGKCALVVDDFAPSRDVLSDMLMKYGLIVRTADSGDAALVELTAAITPFDVVLIDWRMPGLSGVELIRKIRGSSQFGSVPLVIMVTHHGQDEVLQDTKDINLNGIMLKPVTPSFLLDTILGALGYEVRGNQRDRNRRKTKQNGRLMGRNLLLVEDNEINQEIMRTILIGEGATVCVAENGVAAVSAVKAAALPFDLVLMDIQMPIMDGYEATRRIRSNPANAALPIIAMTASAMVEDQEMCLSLGMNDHLPKPINVDQVLETIMRWMKPLENCDLLIESDTNDDLIDLPLDQTSDCLCLLELPEFDVQAALLRVSGDDKFMSRLLISFKQANMTLAARVRAALDSDDIDAAFRMVHSVKGTAGNLGAIHLFEVAEAFHAALKRRDVDTFSSHFEVFKQCLDSVLSILGQLESTQAQATTEPIQSVTYDVSKEQNEQLVQDCLSLAGLLDQRKIKAINLADELFDRMKGMGFEEELNLLKSAIALIDFKSGSSIVLVIVDKLRGMEACRDI